MNWHRLDDICEGSLSLSEIPNARYDEQDNVEDCNCYAWQVNAAFSA